MNNRNTIIGLLLIFSIFLIFSYLFPPPKKENPKPVMEKPRTVAAAAPIDSVTGQPKTLSLFDSLKSFSVSARGNKESYFLENDLLKMRISNEGGKIEYVELKKYKTWDQKPLVLVDPQMDFGIGFNSGDRPVNTNKLFFRPVLLNSKMDLSKPVVIHGKDSLQLAMRLYAGANDSTILENRYIEFLYTLYGDEYMLGFRINFVGMQEIIQSGTNFLDLVWNMSVRGQEKSRKMEDQYSSIYYKFVDDEVNSTTGEVFDTIRGKVQWISYKQLFFSSTLVSENQFSDPKIRVVNFPAYSKYVKNMFSNTGLPYSPSERFSVPMRFYFGPNKFYTLRSYKIDLERQIPLGWWWFNILPWINIYAVIPVFTFFGNLGWNYGIIILILTILLKIVLFPIAFKTYKSSAKMRALKPDIDELNKKFPKKEDALKKQQATMDLYKRAGVNPMAGCVPLLLQMPILFAMFKFFPSSIELRQQPFLWAKDLSSYDPIWTFPNGFSIPWYGDHVSLFALLMTISSIFYTRINDQMMGSQQTQMPGMKTMMYLMPVMFLFWFNDYSSGLSYYYLLANLLTFAQIYIIRATIDEKKLHAQIEANKKKPVKKSGFQKRLEEMAKKKGVAVRR